MKGTDRAMATRLHRDHHGRRAGPLAEDLVRHARNAKDGKIVLPPMQVFIEAPPSGSATRRTSTRGRCG